MNQMLWTECVMMSLMSLGVSQWRGVMVPVGLSGDHEHNERRLKRDHVPSASGICSSRIRAKSDA